MRGLLSRAFLALGLASMAVAAGGAPAGSASQGLAVRALASILPPTSAADVASATTGIMYGDSLTKGNQDNTGTTIETVLGSLSGMTWLNSGVPGQTSTQIAQRQGGLSFTLTLSGNAINAINNSVTAINGNAIQSMATNALAAQPLSTQSDIQTRLLPGTLCGVSGWLMRTSSGGPPSTSEIYFFTPSATASISLDVTPATTSCPAGSTFTVDNKALLTLPSIIWYGRNNTASPTQIKSDIAATVAQLAAAGNANYLVLSVLNSDTASEYSGGSAYATITQLNSDLAALYPGHYLDLRADLVASYDSGTAQDVTDNGRDIPPSTKRFDTLHLNKAGYTFAANDIYTKWLAPLRASWAKTVTQGSLAGLTAAQPYLSSLSVGCAYPSYVALTVCDDIVIQSGTAKPKGIYGTHGGYFVRGLYFNGGDVYLGGIGVTDLYIGTGTSTQRIKLANAGQVSVPISLTVGNLTAANTSAGELALTKIAATGTAPGAAYLKLETVCGTTAGTAKIIVYAGTSTTPSTLLDNIGSGVTGC